MKTIKLNLNGLGRYDDVAPFVLTDGKLELEIILPKSNGLFFLVAENNEKKYKVLIPEDGKLSIDGLTAGELKCEIKHYVRGELVENYKIETLLLRKLDDSCTADPTVAQLLREVQSLKDENAKLREETTSKIQNLMKQINILQQFAKSCISAIPYINDLKIEEENND